jgi:hypothetical protein
MSAVTRLRMYDSNKICIIKRLKMKKVVSSSTGPLPAVLRSSAGCEKNCPKVGEDFLNGPIWSPLALRPPEPMG